jgi:hypothetical protein
MKKPILFFMLILLIAAGKLQALEQVKIKTINDDPYRFRQDIVLIEGGVTQFGEGKTKYSSYYYLKGDWGGIIKVITDKNPLGVNERYRVTGIVVINDKGEVNIIEKSKNKLTGYVPLQTPVGGVGDEEDKKEWLYYLIGGAALLLVIVIILAIVMISSKKKSAYSSPIPTASGLHPELAITPPASVIEGSTIKMSVPPPGTLKLLPGRFEVESGDDTIKEIRFYKTKNQQETEITFGRGEGPNYSHIQLKPLTVSTRQAKLIWTNGKYTLINYSPVNPTVVNGTALEKEGSVTIAEGNKIEMGEVVFIFHEK